MRIIKTDKACDVRATVLVKAYGLADKDAERFKAGKPIDATKEICESLIDAGFAVVTASEKKDKN